MKIWETDNRVVFVVPTQEVERPIRVAGYDDAGGAVTVGYAIGADGSTIDRWRSLSPDQAHELAHALTRAAEKAKRQGLPPLEGIEQYQVESR